MCVAWLVIMWIFGIRVPRLIHMCDMTHSHVWHDSFTCVTWLIHICDICVRHTATHCNTLQHTATHCNTLQHTATSRFEWVAAFTDLPWLIHEWGMCVMTNSHMRIAAFICVTWLIRKRDVSECCLRACVTWLIHACNTMHSRLGNVNNVTVTSTTSRYPYKHRERRLAIDFVFIQLYDCWLLFSVFLFKHCISFPLLCMWLSVYLTSAPSGYQRACNNFEHFHELYHQITRSFPRTPSSSFPRTLLLTFPTCLDPFWAFPRILSSDHALISTNSTIISTNSIIMISTNSFVYISSDSIIYISTNLTIISTHTHYHLCSERFLNISTNFIMSRTLSSKNYKLTSTNSLVISTNYIMCFPTNPIIFPRTLSYFHELYDLCSEWFQNILDKLYHHFHELDHLEITSSII